VDLRKIIGSTSGDYADLRHEETETLSVVYLNNDIETVSVTRDQGYGLRVLKKGGWGFSSFQDDEKLKNHLLATEKQANLVGRSQLRLRGKSIARDTIRSGRKIDPREVKLDEKVELVKNYAKIMKEEAKLETTRVIYRERRKTKVFVNSEGAEIEWNLLFTGIVFLAVARDGNLIQEAHRSVGQYGGFELVQGQEALARDTAGLASRLLTARQIDGGTYPVILDPHLAGVFIHEAFGHLSEADHVYENDDMKKMMTLGREFGVPDLNVNDDGRVQDEAGFIGYDDEGMEARKAPLIKKGKLVGRLHSRETAEILDENPTGNARAITYEYPPLVRMRCTSIEPGKDKFDDIVSSIDRGIYAVDFKGGMTNLEMFTFSSEHAFLIENGKVGALIRDVVLTGNVFDSLKNIAMIGDDFQYFGGLGGCGKGGQSPLPTAEGSPHIKINHVAVGGK